MNALEDFVSAHLGLLKLEQESEVEESQKLLEGCSLKDLQSKGVALLGLIIASRKTGLHGRVLISFQPRWKEKSFPSHNISSGDIVALDHSSHSGTLGADSIASGVVLSVGGSSLTVAFDREGDEKSFFVLDDESHYRVTKLTNDVTYRRIKNALNRLNNYRSGPACNLIDVAFGVSSPSPQRNLQQLDPSSTQQNISDNSDKTDGDNSDKTDVNDDSVSRQQQQSVLRNSVFFNKKLDGSQTEAVTFALQRPDVAIVHGPPGTGKTTTIVEIILQTVCQLKQKVLCCAPSNVAVDNLAERLLDSGQKSLRLVRLGHPARVTNPRLHGICLDSILASSNEGQLVDDIRKELDGLFKGGGEKGGPKLKGQARTREVKELRKELRERESRAVAEILRRSDVVLATCTSGGEEGPLKHFVKDNAFDVVVIDECAQAIEAACWNPLTLGRKAILAGDHLQLPPTITSMEAAKKGLEVSLMERLLKQLEGDMIMRMLTTQYRMNSDIMSWSSDQLYSGRLEAHSSVASHRLVDLRPEIVDSELTSIPVTLVDTAGTDLWETVGDDSVSKGNEGEAQIVKVQVQKLLDAGLKQEEIAVIAPYNLQVEMLRTLIHPFAAKIEIMSVDGFQGREKEAVVISLVRSNSSREVGFLSESRRLNVAVTRARRHLTIVGDSITVGSHAFIQTLVNHAHSVGRIVSAQEWIDQGIISGEGGGGPGKSSNKIGDKQQKNANDRSVKSKNQKQTRAPEARGRKNEPNATAIASSLLSSEGGKVIKSAPEEANPFDYLRVSIECFLMDKREHEFIFDESLTPKERAIVHELAEQMGLLHFSVGEGDSRRIVIKKTAKQKETTAKVPPTETVTGDCPETPEPSSATNKKKKKKKNKKKRTIHDEEDDDDREEDEVEEDKETKATEVLKDMEELKDGAKCAMLNCDLCLKLVPKSNFELHRLRCGRHSSLSVQAASGTTTKQQRPKSAKTTKQAKDLLGEASDDDFDELINLATKMNNVCNLKGCKTKIHVLGQDCDFCGNRFCLSHHMAEIHGCGDAVRAKAKKNSIKAGVLYPGSGIPDKGMDPTKRSHVHRKLESKLEEMGQSRKPKRNEQKD